VSGLWRVAFNSGRNPAPERGYDKIVIARPDEPPALSHFAPIKPGLFVDDLFLLPFTTVAQTDMVHWPSATGFNQGE
jgi:hypothetical protein